MACPPDDEDAFGGGWKPPGDLRVCASLLSRPDCPHDFWREHGTAALHLCLQYVGGCHRDGDFSVERYNWTRVLIVAVYGVVLHVVCLCGFVGNALTVLVLRRRELSRSTSAVYLTAMLVADTLYLAVSYAHYVVVVALGVVPWRVSPLPAYSRVVGVHVLSDFARSVGALLTVAVTADRYVQIRHGARAGRLSTRPRALLLTLLLALAVAAYEVPRALVLRVVSKERKPEAPAGSSQNNTWSGGGTAISPALPPNEEVFIPSDATSASVMRSDFAIASPSAAQLEPCRFQAPTYDIVTDHELVSEDVDAALMYVGHALFMFVPLLTLAVLTALLMRAIGRWNVRRRRLSRSVSPKTVDASLNAVLVSVVITFVLCSTPMAVIGVLREVADLDSFFRNTTAGVLLYYVAVTTLNVNAALSAALFCAFGSKFRKEFAIMLRCRSALDAEGRNGGFSTPSAYATHPATPSGAVPLSSLISSAPDVSPVSVAASAAVARPRSDHGGDESKGCQPRDKANHLERSAKTEGANRDDGCTARDAPNGSMAPEPYFRLTAPTERASAETRDL